MAERGWSSAYARFVAAAGASNVADHMVLVAVPWLASTVTRDPVLIGAVAASLRLPWLLAPLPAGVLADRHDRAALMRVADAARAVLALALAGLALAIAAGVDSTRVAIGALCALSFALGCAEVLRDNSAQSQMARLVEASALERANGRLWAIERGAGLIGAPLAGVLLAVSPAAAPLVMALAFMAAGGLVVVGQRPPQRVEPTPMRVAIAQAWCWMRSHPMIIRLAVVLGLLNGICAAVHAMLVLHAREVLQADGSVYGLLMGAMAAGAIAGSLFGPALVSRWSSTTVLVGVLLNTALCHLAIAFGDSLWWVAIALFAMDFGGMTWNVLTVSWRQRTIPGELLGRVNSVYRLFGWGAMPIGALCAGAVVALLSPSMGAQAALRWLFVGCAAIAAGLALYAARRLRLS